MGPIYELQILESRVSGFSYNLELKREDLWYVGRLTIQARMLENWRGSAFSWIISNEQRPVGRLKSVLLSRVALSYSLSEIQISSVLDDFDYSLRTLRGFDFYFVPFSKEYMIFKTLWVLTDYFVHPLLCLSKQCCCCFWRASVWYTAVRQ